MLERPEEQFPELPMQWRDHGYEIDQRLGKGAYGAVYRLTLMAPSSLIKRRISPAIIGTA